MAKKRAGVKNVLDMDAVDVLAAYRAGKLTPSEAVETYIAHQKCFNPILNSVVETRYEKARAEAARCDELLSQGRMKGKLFGVPMSMKESFDVAGMHSTGALRHFKDRMREKDSEEVRLLREQGAIFLDKTNTPGLCFCQETDNNLFGRANNPWDPSRTTGGSSGGEAALMAAGGAAAGFGSDIGGSIRIPSHFNGVVGFKAGAGQFPGKADFPPITVKHQERMLGFGPITKSVRDAALIYSIIHRRFRPPQTATLPDDLRVVSFGSFAKTTLSDETDKVLHRAQQAIGSNGAPVTVQVPHFITEVAKAWQLIMSMDRGRGIRKLAYPGQPFGFYTDFLKAKFGGSSKNHPYLSWGLIGSSTFAPTARQSAWVDRFVPEAEREIEQLLSPNGVFVIPSYPTPALPHGEVYNQVFSIRMTYQNVLPYIALPNVFGMPSMVVPCGRDESNLPIGLQVVSQVGNEETLFRVAMVLEKELGGYQRCNLYD